MWGARIILLSLGGLGTLLAPCSDDPDTIITPESDAGMSYPVGGTVSGLDAGESVTLLLSGALSVMVTENGPFTFPGEVDGGNTYVVTVPAWPQNKTCSVGNATGMVTGPVTDIQVVCSMTSFFVSGSATGLASGNSVQLSNNGGEALNVTANGGFVFTQAVADGALYSVEVVTQPTTPNQTCTVTNGTGMIQSANVANVSVSCVTTPYSVGGSVTGLGTTMTIQNNGTDTLVITENGEYEFPIKVDDGETFSVTVLAQPTTPPQTCVLGNETGTISGQDEEFVNVACTPATFTVGGMLSNLGDGSLVLQNNGGDDLTLTENGEFTFAIPLLNSDPYSVAVAMQPTLPTQNCDVFMGAGAINSASITNVNVVCNSPPKIVFVTSMAYDGDLDHNPTLSGNGDGSGIEEADEACRLAAEAGDLPGTYRAWLSAYDDTDQEARDRVAQTTYGYQDAAGNTIADDWTDLTDASLDQRLNTTEFGTTAGITDATEVWTQTTFDGQASDITTDGSCANYSSNDSGQTGGVGTIGGFAGGTWTNASAGACDIARSLFCFQE